jgi:hypothetical protein
LGAHVLHLDNFAMGNNLEKKMKKFVLAAAFAGAASTAFAGNVSEPIMEMAPVVVMEETAGSSSSAGLIIPLILVVLIAAALAD